MFWTKYSTFKRQRWEKTRRILLYILSKILFIILPFCILFEWAQDHREKNKSRLKGCACWETFKDGCTLPSTRLQNNFLHKYWRRKRRWWRIVKHYGKWGKIWSCIQYTINVVTIKLQLLKLLHLCVKEIVDSDWKNKYISIK